MCRHFKELEELVQPNNGRHACRAPAEPTSRCACCCHGLACHVTCGVVRCCASDSIFSRNIFHKLQRLSTEYNFNIKSVKMLRGVRYGNTSGLSSVLISLASALCEIMRSVNTSEKTIENKFSKSFFD